MATRSGSLESLRELNRLRIVDALRQHGEATRAEIIRRTGLSRSTVSTLVGELLHQGVLAERSAPAPAHGAAPQGRPPVVLSLDPSAGAAVGIDLDHRRIRVAVSDLSRTVLAEAVRASDVDHDAEGTLDAAAELVDEVLAEAGVDRRDVVGAGMGLAGPVDHARGALHASAILPGWARVDAAEEMERRIEIPIHLENDANLGALAEVTLGAGRARRARDAAYIQVSSGIGAGLIVDGRPYRGFHGTAGEIGHLLVDENGSICRCGNRGCLETLASGPAIVELLRRSHGDDLTIERVIELARRGDAGCRRAIADAGLVVGRCVAALCNLFNPEMVVVGGELGAAGELLVGPLRDAVRRFALPTATADLEVVAGELGERANLLGALALAIAQSGDPIAARLTGEVAAS